MMAQKRTICPKCGRRPYVRADGKISIHRMPRAYRYQKSQLPFCPASGTLPAKPEEQ